MSNTFDNQNSISNENFIEQINNSLKNIIKVKIKNINPIFKIKSNREHFLRKNQCLRTSVMI